MQSTDILSLSRNVKSGDSTNREGAAARLYWPRLFGPDFIRDRYGSPPKYAAKLWLYSFKSSSCKGIDRIWLAANTGDISS
jgi:hypothetical protein